MESCQIRTFRCLDVDMSDVHLIGLGYVRGLGYHIMCYLLIIILVHFHHNVCIAQSFQCPQSTVKSGS
jgi:hypothetical protein